MWSGRRDAARKPLTIYMDAVAAGASQDELARLARRLDPTLVEAVDRLRARDDAHAPDPAFLERLERQLMNSTSLAWSNAIRQPPTSAAPTNGRRDRIATRRSPRGSRLPLRQWASSPLVTMALVAVVVVAIFVALIWTGNERPNPAVLPPAASPSSTAPATPTTAATPSQPGRPGDFVWRVRGEAETFLAPVSIALDPAGRVWFADGQHGYFEIFDADGTALGTWGSAGAGNGQFNLARSDGVTGGAIAFGADGTIYVADTGNHRIQKFAADRSFVSAWGEKGTGDGQFLDPFSIAVDSQEEVVVYDFSRDDVQVFASDGRFLRRFGVNGGSPPADRDLWLPLMTVDHDGNIYVSSAVTNNILKFDAQGNQVLVIGKQDPSGLNKFSGQVYHPSGLAVDDAGRIYVADEGFDNQRIQVFTADGTFLDKLQTLPGGRDTFTLALPSGIALDGQGNLYVAEYSADRLSKIRLFPPLWPLT
jgi:sugar lactone lactonase YvrE